MNPNLDDLNYDYFRTVEEKKAALPKIATDEFFSILSREWKMVGMGYGNENFEDVNVYRRRKPTPQYPRWVKCSERLPYKKFGIWELGWEGLERKLWGYHAGNKWFHAGRESEIDVQPTHWREDIELPPPSKAEPEKDEFEVVREAFAKYRESDSDSINTDYKGFVAGFNAALTSKESKKGGA